MYKLISMRLEAFSWSAPTIPGTRAYPGILTNAAAVLAASDPPDYRARPDFPRPAAHAKNAVAAVLSLYKQGLDARVSYTVAKAALTAVLLASIRSDNETYLEATMHPNPVYSLSPRQTDDAMFTKHGQTTDYWARPAKA
jgi:hypothetical protein